MSKDSAKSVPAPKLAYQPRFPKKPRTRLGLIGCGGITTHHLSAARSLGVPVLALCDVNAEAARRRRDEFFPEAEVYTDARELLARDDITAVDIATHPAIRASQVELALRAGKHVLSQKPFVLDLRQGGKLTDLADAQGLVLAVNQNGRWAPHFAWLLEAVRSGLLGDIQTLDMNCTWDHSWVKGTAFESIRHLVLYDFAIHWFDIAANVFEGREFRSACGRAIQARNQTYAPPALAHTALEFESGLATLSFNAHAAHGHVEWFTVVGSKGTLRATGPLCNIRELTLQTKRGTSVISLEGNWFPDGFRGTLGEFLLAVEGKREPSHSARQNLRSLEICFAALASAETGRIIPAGHPKARKAPL